MTDTTLFERHTEPFASDIGMYYCGRRIRTKNHVYGPEIRSHFLLVLVREGTATLYLKDRQLSLGADDLLVMFPEETVFYKAHSDWSIQWIGVDGEQIYEIFDTLGVTREHPILSLSDPSPLVDVMTALYDNSGDTPAEKYKTKALIYEFFSLLQGEAQRKPSSDPIKSAERIIRFNYNNALCVRRLAEDLHLDYAYFSRLFKRRTGKSPKRYILDLQIERARELLRTTDSPVKAVASSVGFPDAMYFSRVFTNAVGCSPSAYRETHSK